MRVYDMTTWIKPESPPLGLPWGPQGPPVPGLVDVLLELSWTDCPVPLTGCVPAPRTSCRGLPDMTAHRPASFAFRATGHSEGAGVPAPQHWGSAGSGPVLSDAEPQAVLADRSQLPDPRPYSRDTLRRVKNVRPRNSR